MNKIKNNYMLSRQAAIQFKKLDIDTQQKLANRVEVFSASKNNLITYFSKNKIMALVSLTK
jgi:hypothetical protein